MIAISPRHHISNLSEIRHMSFEDKLDIFEARVSGWQLDIADAMMNDSLPAMRHAGYAALSVIMSFVENISKYYSGDITRDSTKKQFLKGLDLIYPNKFNDQEQKIIYEDLRSGLYHLGLAYGQVVLSANYPEGLSFLNGILQVNPHILVKEFKDYLKRYIELLQDNNNVELRSNFEKRFNFDNKLI